MDDLQVAIEAKAVPRVHADHLRGLRELAREPPNVSAKEWWCALMSSLDGPRMASTFFPRVFAQRLWQGQLIAG